jgi:mercuric reductase
MPPTFDLVVLGSGSAARDAARKASTEFGATVALVESTRWGGSCPNVACKPTKAYLVAADLARDLRRLGPKLGLSAPGELDLARVRDWKNTLRKPQERWHEELAERFETVRGEARLRDARTVDVDGRELTAERILVATGSRTAVPAIPGLERLDWVDHVGALELDALPRSLLVLGGGPVGLEFAQIFARFGSRVAIVQGAARISPRSDEEAAAALAAALADDGVEIVTGTTVERFEGSHAVLVNGASLEADRVLLASGRVPNVEALGLDRVGIRTHRAGIDVDERMRTSVAGVWAAGDVTGLAQFTPVAQYQARIAVDDMFASSGRTADYSTLPTAIFTDPELAAVGLTEHDALERGLDALTATNPITNVTRSQYIEERNGLYKLVYERGTGRVLGIHVVSRNASDVVQGLAIAFARGVTVAELAAAHHIYPSWGEGVKAAAERAVPV